MSLSIVTTSCCGNKSITSTKRLEQHTIEGFCIFLHTHSFLDFMITTFFISFFTETTMWFLLLFDPYTGLPPEYITNIDWAFGKIYAFDCVLPIDWILAITLLFLALATPLLIIRFFMMLAKRRSGEIS